MSRYAVPECARALVQKVVLPALFCSAALLPAHAVHADRDSVLERLAPGVHGGSMLKDYFDALRAPLHKERLEEIRRLASSSDVALRAQEMKSFFQKALGDFPPRCPLNARAAGEGMGEGFRYECVIYDSMPHHPVTAVLFLPLEQGPHPAVLVPCGHSDNGKASEAYQRACILLARHGIAALIYDPIGQGERALFLDKQGKPDFGPTMQHTAADIVCMLTGTSMAMYHIWDGMRGLDYLQSRPDILPDKLGCTGNSGGGTLTSYLMALDDRIVAAAPSCYLTTFDHLLSSIGPQDAEQNLHAQLFGGLDHADYILMRAPRPTLICSAVQDFFSIDGARATFAEARQVYSLMGRPECIAMTEADAKHGFTTVLRVAAVNWMRRWLLGQPDPITDEDFAVLPESEMQCSVSGQIFFEPGYRSLMHIIAEGAAVLAAKRGEPGFKDHFKQGQIGHAQHLVEASSPCKITEQTGAEEAAGDYRRVPAVYIAEQQGEPRYLPAYVYPPKAVASGTVLYLHDAGKQALLKDSARLDAWLGGGKTVIAVDISGIGETASNEDPDWEDRMGADWQDFYRAYLLGQSVVGIRSMEIRALAEHLLEQTSQPIELVAVGELTVPALHAAAFARTFGLPDLFSHVTLEGGISSWQAVIDARSPCRQLMNVVPGALEVYDLPDLAASLPKGKLDWRPDAVPVR